MAAQPRAIFNRYLWICALIMALPGVAKGFDEGYVFLSLHQPSPGQASDPETLSGVAETSPESSSTRSFNTNLAWTRCALRLIDGRAGPLTD